MLSKFGEKIEMLQAEQGVSTNELAKRAGIKRQRVWQLKKSIRPNPVTIHKLSKAFQVPVSYFLEA